jgi:hypothetical protein
MVLLSGKQENGTVPNATKSFQGKVYLMLISVPIQEKSHSNVLIARGLLPRKAICKNTKELIQNPIVVKFVGKDMQIKHT